MITNADRAEYAAAACKAYGVAKRLRYEEEIEDTIVDLISDLLHLACKKGIDTARCLRLAGDHFGCELMDEVASDD
jgi:hypothetical protein